MDELLIPMLVNARQFPSENHTLLQTQEPTTMSLMPIGALSWAVSVDPGSTPFECPVPAKSRDGLHIKNRCWGTLIEDSDWDGSATYDESFAIYSRSRKFVIAGNSTPGKMNL